jgi:hypothetical protein
MGPRIAVGIGLLFALAGSFASPEGTSIEEAARRIWVPLPDWLLIAAAAAMTIASLAFVVMTRPWRRRPNQDEDERYQQPQPVSPLLGALLLLLSLTPGLLLAVAILWFAQSGISLIPRLDGIMGTGSGAGRGLLEEAPWVPTSDLTTGLIGTLALLVGAGSLGFVLWLLIADRLSRLRGEFVSPHGPLAAAVVESLDDLRREPDPRVAILRIYGNFERVLAGAASPRRPWQTPVEFMRSALGRLPLPAAAVRRLTEIFELARFSQHPVGAEERDSAWHCLIEIRGALDKTREAPDAAAT